MAIAYGSITLTTVGIKKITVYYRLTKDKTAEATGATWSTTMPTNLLPGYTLYTKTVTEYMDGTVGKAYTSALQGATGAQGYGMVAFITRQFTEEQWNVYGTIGQVETWSGTSSSRNGCRVGDFFEIVGTATDTGKSHVLQYKSTTSSGDLKGTCISHRCADRGISILRVDIEYVISSSSTTAPTSGWSTNTPTWENGKYIWQRTKTIYSKGDPTYSTPVNISGSKGATGQGISKITQQYYLSTSNTVQAGGSWSDTPASWIIGRYYWIRSKIDWINPTSTTYSTAVLSQELNAIYKTVNDNYNQINAGLNKWSIAEYPYTGADKNRKQIVSTPYNFADFNKLELNIGGLYEIEDEELTGKQISYADKSWLMYKQNGFLYGKTFVEFKADTSFTTNLAVMDSATVYLNGLSIHVSDTDDIEGAQDGSMNEVTLQFIKGWNCIEFLLNHYTSDNDVYFYLSSTISKNANCIRMDSRSSLYTGLMAKDITSIQQSNKLTNNVNELSNQMQEQVKWNDAQVDRISKIEQTNNTIQSQVEQTTKQMVNDIKLVQSQGNEVLETPYTMKDNDTAIFTAIVYRAQQDVTNEFIDKQFTWYKKNETNESLTVIGTGKTLTVKRSDFNYGGVVVCQLNTERDDIILTDRNKNILTDRNGYTLTIRL